MAADRVGAKHREPGSKATDGGRSPRPPTEHGEHPMLWLQRTAGNDAAAAAAAGANLGAGRYAWAGGVLSGGSKRVAALAGLAAGGGAAARLIHEAGDDWVEVKEKYLSDETMMGAIVAFRKTYVDGLINDLRRDPRFRDMKTRAAGSTALSSDYDITFMGPQGAAAVQEFNRRFRAHWGKEAGTLFDTNVYAEDVLPDQATVLEGRDDITRLGDSAGAANVDARLDEGLQDVASLIKVRKNMTRAAWSDFTGRVLGLLAASPAVAQEANARFSDANTIYERTYVGEIIAKLESEPKGKARLKALRDEGKMNIAIVEAVMGDDEGIAASNRVYEEKLLYAAELERRRDKVPPDSRAWKTLTVDLRKAKADAMLFANEPYFSAGTLYHVVGNTQAKYGAELSLAAHFQSLDENYGDVLKELHHLHGKSWSTVAVKSSKYVWRMLDAAAGLQAKGVDLGIDVAPLRAAAKVALDVRQQAAGCTNGAGALAALKGAGLHSTDDLASVLGQIATNANVAYRGRVTPAGGQDAP